jgi:hypothetical protein
MSATVMVARVTLYSPDAAYYPSTSHLSDLHFHVRSTRQADNIELDGQNLDLLRQ